MEKLDWQVCIKYNKRINWMGVRGTQYLTILS
jgi:hypothetical protein